MSKLRRRIIGQSRNAAAAAGDYHPYGTVDTPMTMPMVHVEFGGGGAMVQQMTGITAGRNGGVIPATAPGTFGQVHLAGGGRHG
jgi:hypothetical protein